MSYQGIGNKFAKDRQRWRHWLFDTDTFYLMTLRLYCTNGWPD
jgi:hypothetical protein